MLPAIDKFDPRPDNQLLDRARHENFACLRVAHNSRSDVHSYSADILVHQFTLAGMQTNPHVKSKGLNCLQNGNRAANCSCRPIDGGEKTIAARTPLGAAEPGKLFPHCNLIRGEKIAPAVTAKLERQAC